MLILAGVSLNAIVGDNGILTMAQKAKDLSEEAARREELEMMLIEHLGNIDTDESLNSFLRSKIGKEIDNVFNLPDPEDSSKTITIIQKEDYYYAITGTDGEYELEKVNIDANNIGTGYTIANKDTFSGGTMNFNPGENGNAVLIFNEAITADYNFNIRSGNVTILINNDMVLTNENVKDENGNGRAAINIEPGATLNLNILAGVKLTVNSGYGKAGETATGFGASGGPRTDMQGLEYLV